MLPREKERRRSLLTQASQMAESGQFPAWREIEAALIKSGRSDTQRVFASANFRRTLDRQCAKARRGAGKGRGA